MKNPFTSPRRRRSWMVYLIVALPLGLLLVLTFLALALTLPYRGLERLILGWLKPLLVRVDRWIESAPEET